MAASTSGTGTETGTEGRLVLEATGPAASLERPVRFDADDVDRIELRLAGSSSAALPAAQILMQSHGWRGLRAPGDYFLARHRGEAGWHAPLTADEKDLVSLMYDSGVAYADAQVGRLIDHLASRGLAGRTVLIVTSDHGEALREDDRAGHTYLDD